MVDRAPKDAKQSAAPLVPKSTLIERKLMPPTGAHTGGARAHRDGRALGRWLSGAVTRSCALTSALWRVVEGAQRRRANVAHQRAVRRHVQSPRGNDGLRGTAANANTSTPPNSKKKNTASGQEPDMPNCTACQRSPRPTRPAITRSQTRPRPGLLGAACVEARSGMPSNVRVLPRCMRSVAS
jgi:hypothetical protein